MDNFYDDVPNTIKRAHNKNILNTQVRDYNAKIHTSSNKNYSFAAIGLT
jgi:hypothetical protein